MNNSIIYKIGDATLPQSEVPTIIAHSCNDLGVFGAGFVVALGKRYPLAKSSYLEWASNKKFENIPFQLGEVQFVNVSQDPVLWVANMIGQKGIGFKKGPPVRYEALHEGLGKVAKFAKNINAEVVMPRIGSGLGGGDWSIVEKLIEQTLIKSGIPVVVCDLGDVVIKNDEPIFGW